MRFLLRWVSLACLAAWVVWAPEARGSQEHVRAETASVAPTATVLAVPTSSVLSTSYALPTYVPPTVYSNAYVPTSSYLSPTVHVLPTYRTISYPSQSRIVEGPFYTTTQYDYLSPTTYCTPVILECPVATIRELPRETTEFAPPETEVTPVPDTGDVTPRPSPRRRRPPQSGRMRRHSGAPCPGAASPMARSSRARPARP